MVNIESVLVVEVIVVVHFNNIRSTVQFTISIPKRSSKVENFKSFSATAHSFRPRDLSNGFIIIYTV